MKLIIAGSRDVDLDVALLNIYIVDYGFDEEGLEVVSGGAKGPDAAAITWAKVNNIPCHIFLPDWNTFGKKAGILRNKQMGDFADELLAFWDGNSRGTKHMIDYMTSLGKPVKVIEIAKTTI